MHWCCSTQFPEERTNLGRGTETQREREGARDAPACETRGDGGGAGEDCFSPYLVNAVVVARAVLLRGVLGRVIIVLPSFAA